MSRRHNVLCLEAIYRGLNQNVRNDAAEVRSDTHRNVLEHEPLTRRDCEVGDNLERNRDLHLKRFAAGDVNLANRYRIGVNHAYVLWRFARTAWSVRALSACRMRCGE